MLSVTMSWLLLEGPRGEEMLSQLGASTAGWDSSRVLGRMLPAQERSGERAPGLQGSKESNEDGAKAQARPRATSGHLLGSSAGGWGPGGRGLLGTEPPSQGLADQRLETRQNFFRQGLSMKSRASYSQPLPGSLEGSTDHRGCCVFSALPRGSLNLNPLHYSSWPLPGTVWADPDLPSTITSNPANFVGSHREVTGPLRRAAKACCN